MSNKITVITVTYNAASVLEYTILSVINQTYKSIEYIIIDGGSTDGTVDIIKKYEDKIDYWVSESDKGIYDAMNKGVSKATGTYCNFMNAGDKFYDFHVINNVFSCDCCEDILAGIAKSRHKSTWTPPDDEKLSLFFISMCHQATFIKTDLLRKYPYDINLKIVADHKFWLESLILNNCSYKALSIIVCDFAFPGMSNNYKLLMGEKQKVWMELFPPRIVRDYMLFEQYYNPLYRLLFPMIQSKFLRSFIFAYRKLFR